MVLVEFGADLSPYEESTSNGEVWERYNFFYSQLLANISLNAVRHLLELFS